MNVSYDEKCNKNIQRIFKIIFNNKCDEITERKLLTN